jgi:carboxyl-terminal processing protease
MKKRIIIGLVSVGLVFIFISLALSRSEKRSQERDELYKQVSLFSDALAIIQTDYVELTQPKDLIYGALKGMLSSLDPHSQFLDPDTYNELKIDTEGKFGGIGIEITIKDGLLTIVTPIEDTPAWKAGVKPNDRIVKIGNELTRDITLTEAVKKLRGKPREPVTITILRESERKLLEFTIVRDIIKIKDIKEPRILEDNIGYLRLVEFRENTPRDMRSTLMKLRKEGMSAFILDLRNNPGGLLNVAVKIAEMFIPEKKLVVLTKGRKPTQSLEFLSETRNPFLDLPMVVLINEGSASGSEIVAGALQDYKRAIIVGIKSFGKGSVQTIVPLTDGSALRLTTSKYFTPLGKEIHGKGVQPDIAVEEGKIEIINRDELPVEKAQDIFEKIEVKEEKTQEKSLKDYRSDNQLMRAVDILKALRIYEKNDQ